MVDSTQGVKEALEYMQKLRSPWGGVFASLGENYQAMTFGRDSVEAADDFFRDYPDMALGVIDSLARIQGRTDDDTTGEERGKIPHQHMELYMNGTRIPKSAESLMHRLGKKWGGDENGFTNFDSLDATPMFVRLVARYALVYGAHILDGTVQHISGEHITRREVLLAAIEWIMSHIEASSIHLLEFRRVSKNSIVIQNWRDSGSAFIHENGQQANIKEFIAPVEVQAYAYDALLLSGNLFETLGAEYRNRADEWRRVAGELRQRVFDMFWLEDRQCFAMGLDRDEQYRPRQITTPSSSQGVMLDTRLFSGLDDEQRQKYVGGVARALYSDDFLTPVGIRCRGKSFAHLTGFADYHGAWAVWAKETYDVAKGFQRQGFDKLARDLCNRILHMDAVSGNHYELLYVNPYTDEVDYFPTLRVAGADVSDDAVIVATNMPDIGQAWTVSAVLAIRRNTKPFHLQPRSQWVINLEDTLLRSRVLRVPVLKSKTELEIYRDQQPRYVIDIDAGIEADKKWNPDWWQ